MSGAQVRVILPELLEQEIAAVRERWDPERALDDPAHVTVVYHDEAPDPGLLIARLRDAAETTKPFQLLVGRPHRFPPPAGGAFLEVSDPSGAIAALRKRVLEPPFGRRSSFGLHVTVLHSDRGERLEAAWSEIQGIPRLPPFRVSSLEVIGAHAENPLTVDLSGG